MKKRLLSVLLVLGIALTLLTATAFAMQINAELPSGKTVKLEVESTDSIENVKQKIQDKEGIPPHQIELYYNEHHLEEGKTLADYNVIKESTINVNITAAKSWSYALDPDDSSTIIATANTGEKESLSIIHYSCSYDGKVSEAKLSTDTIGQYTVSTDDIRYYQGNKILTGAPKDSGLYTAKITVGGVTAYTTFAISPAQLAVEGSSVKVYDKTYDGTCDADVSFKVSGIANSSDDVTVSAQAKFADSNVSDDKIVHVHFTISGEDSGNYASPFDVDIEASILPKSIDEVTIETIDAQNYTGNAICPDIVVKDASETLVKDKDYIVKYVNNISSPDAKAVITGCGNYTGTVEKHFDIICTVSFDTNGGSEIDNQKVNIGGCAEKPDAPDRDGYEFGGWYSDDGLEKAWEFDKNAVTDNITLYAKWTVKDNGGADEKSAQDNDDDENNADDLSADSSAETNTKTDAKSKTNKNTNTNINTNNDADGDDINENADAATADTDVNTAVVTVENDNSDEEGSHNVWWIVLICVIVGAVIIYIGKKKRDE